MSNNYKHLLKPFDTYISSKVIFYESRTKEDTIIQLFDEYQIKWFNQQTANDLYDYFTKVIEFYKLQDDYLCVGSNLIETQNNLKNGLNYPIVPSEDEWLEHGWKDNRPNAVYVELQRVLDEYDRKTERESA